MQVAVTGMAERRHEYPVGGADLLYLVDYCRDRANRNADVFQERRAEPLDSIEGAAPSLHQHL